jgi:hypothetical protein
MLGIKPLKTASQRGYKDIVKLLRWNTSPTSMMDSVLMAAVVLQTLVIYHNIDCSSLIDLF